MVGKCSGIVFCWTGLFILRLLLPSPQALVGLNTASELLCTRCAGRLEPGKGFCYRHQRVVAATAPFPGTAGTPERGLGAQPQCTGGPPLESASPASRLAQGPTGICPYVDRKLILIKNSQRSGSIQCQQQMEKCK